MQQLSPKALWYFFFIFLGRALIVFLYPVFVLVGFIAGTDDLGSFGSLVMVVIAWILVGLLFARFWAGLSYSNFKYELKDEGLRIERGVIWKKYVTIPYDRIQNVDILRGLIARILGISDLQIQTAGGITNANYGSFSEGRLPGLLPEVAEQLRDEVLKVSKQSRRTAQGL